MISTHCFSTSNRPSLFPLPPSRRLPLSISSYRKPTTTLVVSASGAGDSSAFEGARLIVRLSASTVFFLGISAFSLTSFYSGRASTGAAVAVSLDHLSAQDCVDLDSESQKVNVDDLESEELRKAFEKWKSKTFALTVPLRIVALRGSVPPSWIKDFVQCQGKRSKLSLEARGSLEGIFSEISTALSKGKTDGKSAVVADLVTVGDSWLNMAIQKAMIEPIQAAEKQEWFKDLPGEWKVHLCRNTEGMLDPKGKIWAVPYRWGSMVIMYKKSKFKKHGLAPIKDWGDLWRPELAGKISMVDSPREIIGAVLKFMGASYNSHNIDEGIPGGINAVQQNLVALVQQVRLFDSVHYLKAFSVGDVWVAVGWSNDILPAAMRSSDVAVVVPKSGASLWADLWAVPAAARCATEKAGGRVRGPSPLINQWFSFCLQPAREVPFKQGVVPGASPSCLGHAPSKEVLQQLTKGAPQLETNLVAGVPPPEIPAKCEFLEPLPEHTIAEYRSLMSCFEKRPPGLIHRIHRGILSLLSGARMKLLRQNERIIASIHVRVSS